MSNRQGSKECNEPDCNEFGTQSDCFYLFYTAVVLCVRLVHTLYIRVCIMYIDKSSMECRICYFVPLFTVQSNSADFSL